MRRMRFLKSRSFAIDLGNNNTIVTDSDNRTLAQRSYIVFNRSNNSVKAVGDEAYHMFEKNHEDLKAVKPLQGGVIADYESATQMIRELVRRVYTGRTWFRRFENIISGVPFNTTEVERRALRSVLDQFNSNNTYLVYEPLAAAIGLGLNIQEPNGKLVIDIGGGITEIVVISLSGIAAFQSLKVGGDSFDTAIQDHFRRHYSMAIGLKTAEQVKMQVGAVIPDLDQPPAPMMVKGKDMVSGIPVLRKIGHQEVAQVLEKPITSIEHGIIQTLETCPPELSADICYNGIHVTGGGALLQGLKKRFEKKVGLQVHIDPQPMYAVSRGISTVMKETKKYRSVLFE